MFKRCKVVMLPINGKASIYQSKLSGTFGVFKSFKDIKHTDCVDCTPSFQLPLKDVNGFHLYILSDDEIKEGTKLTHRINGEVHTFIRYFDTMLITHYNTEIGTGEDWTEKTLAYFKEQIVATTDSSLNLPSPSQSFIEKYVEEYNKGNKIEDVMVEYTDEIDTKVANDIPIGLYSASILKVNSKDNTITIKKIKDSWTIKELNEEAMKFYKKYHGILNQGDMQSIAKFINEL